MNIDTQKKLESDLEFQSIVKNIIENKEVQKMKNFRQHFDTTCFDHCYLASYYCYKICKKLNLDYHSAARAAMLHDFFLYDWREKNSDRKGLHAFTHGKTAYQNASKIFNLNNKEKDIIIKHMWPVTPAFPSTKESYILTLVDKYCAIKESLEGSGISAFSKKMYQYAYVFLAFLLLKKFF